MAIGGFFGGLGDRLVAAGAAGSNPAAYYQNLQEQRKQQQLAEIMSSPVTQGEKISALAQIDPTFALQYMKQAQGPEMPADVRTFEYMQSLSPEQQQAFRELKNPMPQMTPYQQEQLRLERMKLEGNADYQRTQAQQRAQQLDMQARALEQAGRRQEAAAVRQEAQMVASEADQPKMFDYGNVPDPLARINDPKRRDIETGLLGREAEKAIREQDEFIRAAQAEKQAMQTFEAAMERQGGSGGLSRFVPDVLAGLDPELADMMQASSFMVPKMREPGSGATSDFDARMFEKATIGRDKPTETNQRIIQARKAAADNVIAKADFLEAFRADNGHIRGAEAAWRRYLQDNPIFDPNNTKDMQLNPNRRDWREYFGRSSQQTSDTVIPEASAIEAELKRRGVM